MSEQDAIRHWSEGSRRMLQAALHSVESGDYEVALFSSHLAVEKMLKARYIAKKHSEPPMSHKLVDLCVAIGEKLSEQEQDQLNELTAFSAFARYGDESWLEVEATEENCRQWLDLASAFLDRYQP